MLMAADLAHEVQAEAVGGRDWPLMSLILTTPMRTTPAALGVTTGAAGAAGAVGAAVAGAAAGSGAVSK